MSTWRKTKIHGSGVREGHVFFLKVSGNPKTLFALGLKLWWRRKGGEAAGSSSPGPGGLMAKSPECAVTHHSAAASPSGVGDAGDPETMYPAWVLVHLLQPQLCRCLQTSRLVLQGEAGFYLLTHCQSGHSSFSCMVYFWIHLFSSWNICVPIIMSMQIVISWFFKSGNMYYFSLIMS